MMKNNQKILIGIGILSFVVVLIVLFVGGLYFENVWLFTLLVILILLGLLLLFLILSKKRVKHKYKENHLKHAPLWIIVGAIFVFSFHSFHKSLLIISLIAFPFMSLTSLYLHIKAGKKIETTFDKISRYFCMIAASGMLAAGLFLLLNTYTTLSSPTLLFFTLPVALSLTMFFDRYVLEYHLEKKKIGESIFYAVAIAFAATFGMLIAILTLR